MQDCPPAIFLKPFWDSQGDEQVVILVSLQKHQNNPKNHIILEKNLKKKANDLCFATKQKFLPYFYKFLRAWNTKE